MGHFYQILRLLINVIFDLINRINCIHLEWKLLILYMHTFQLLSILEMVLFNGILTIENL
jgi:hypothetical protein